MTNFFHVTYLLIIAQLLAMSGLSASVEADSKSIPAVPIEEESDQFIHDIDQRKWVFPVSGVTPSLRSDQVFQAFPHDGAIFLEGSAITLGWQPVKEDGVNVLRYEIYIGADAGIQDVVVSSGENDEFKTTTYLFFPKKPGRYFWQVRAYLNEDLFIPSIGRYFEVVR
ncbi:MAG: hypothetical protein CSA22_09455 [Deltaproteobacteria bacterium]|nr:MAG: hypothetical protein CSA22_09455 [Deltaproteobacteria bacterium]